MYTLHASWKPQYHIYVVEHACYAIYSKYMTYKSRLCNHVHIAKICRQHFMSGPVTHKAKMKYQ